MSGGKKENLFWRSGCNYINVVIHLGHKVHSQFFVILSISYFFIYFFYFFLVLVLVLVLVEK